MSIKVCFVSLSAYPFLTNKDCGFAGGEEKREVLFGKSIMKHGTEVSFIVYSQNNEEVESEETYDNIRIIKTYNHNNAKYMTWISKIKYIYNSITKADADMYVQGAGAPGIVALLCLLKRKKYVFFVASDANAEGRAPINPNLINNMLSKLDIRLSRLVISQNEWQSKVLFEKFKVKSVLINNPIHIPKLSNHNNRKFIIWVATIRTVKRPDLFLELAKAMPSTQFLMIGGPDKHDSLLYNDISNKASSIPNLKFLGFVSPFEIDNYYNQASILVNTSLIEGFPMSFLEAWAHGIPVLTLGVDPGGIIQKRNIGFCSKSITELASYASILINNHSLYHQVSSMARKYVSSEHDVDALSYRLFYHLSILSSEQYSNKS